MPFPAFVVRKATFAPLALSRAGGLSHGSHPDELTWTARSYLEVFVLTLLTLVLRNRKPIAICLHSQGVRSRRFSI